MGNSMFTLGLGIAIIGVGVRGLPSPGAPLTGTVLILLGGLLVALSPFLP